MKSKIAFWLIAVLYLPILIVPMLVLATPIMDVNVTQTTNGSETIWTFIIDNNSTFNNTVDSFIKLFFKLLGINPTGIYKIFSYHQGEYGDNETWILNNDTGTFNFTSPNSNNYIRIDENMTIKFYTTAKGHQNVSIWAKSTYDGDTSHGNYNFPKIMPTISLEKINQDGYSSVTMAGATVPLNFTINETSLDSCWYEYNNQNVTIPCSNGVNTDSNFTAVKNAKTINVYVNDTFGNEAKDHQAWKYSITINNESFNNESYETQQETFKIDILPRVQESLTRVYLNYNGTEHLAFKDGNVWSKTITIPNNNIGNNSIKWRLVYNNQNYNYSNASYQNVEPIQMGLCNSTLTKKVLNFTIKDEVTQSLINPSTNPTTFLAYFKFWLGDGSYYKEFSYSNQNSSTLNNIVFCVKPNETFYTNSQISYSANDYQQRQYYLNNASLPKNETKKINLYLLSNTLAQKFFHTVRQGTGVLQNAIITISKYYEAQGKYITIGIRETDSSGQFIEFLDLDKKYKYIITKGNNLLGIKEKTSICKSAPCTINLNVQEASSNLFSGYYDYFAQNVQGGIKYNDSSGVVTANFIDTTGLAHYFRFVVNKVVMNDTSFVICDSKSYTTAGSLSCNLSEFTGDYKAKLYISRSPEKLVEYLDIIRSGLKGLSLTGILASLFIFITIVFSGFRSPQTTLVLIPFALLALKLMGFLPISWTFILVTTLIIIWMLGRFK